MIAFEFVNSLCKYFYLLRYKYLVIYLTTYSNKTFLSLQYLIVFKNTFRTKPQKLNSKVMRVLHYDDSGVFIVISRKPCEIGFIRSTSIAYPNWSNPIKTEYMRFQCTRRI